MRRGCPTSKYLRDRVKRRIYETIKKWKRANKQNKIKKWKYTFEGAATAVKIRDVYIRRVRFETRFDLSETVILFHFILLFPSVMIVIVEWPTL